MKERLRIPSGAEGIAFSVQSPMMPRASHRHEELEVNLVISGRAAYLFGNERVALAAGSMIWLFPEQEHVLIDCSSGFVMWVLVFKQEFVGAHARTPVRERLRMEDPGEILCRQLPPRTVDVLDAVYQDVASGLAGSDFGFSNAALAHALVASWQAFQFSRENITLTDVHPAVAKAVHLISAADEPVPLPELARRAGLSSSRLSRLFKKQTGTSLTAFRQRKCLERFLGIYRSGGKYSLTEAALLAGFGSYPQFHRVFRRCLGQSPAVYARSAKAAGPYLSLK